ncbi:MAG TPA: Xaa-Pro peptidase family protein [Syntrophorhabdaceae bacterium]|nr:Xaa-Pro peptidase family protein [Syntrophorhabdaceae bacterium]
MLKSLNVAELTPKEEVHARINKLKERMEKQGIALTIILQNVDLFYFTGTLQKGVLAVSVDRDPVFFVEKSLARAMEETPLEITPIKKDKDIKDILGSLGMLGGRCGMELDVLPVLVFERWKNILGYDNAVDVWPLIRDLRLIKSPFEIRQIKRSGEIVTRVFEKAKEIIQEGMREVDIAAMLESEGRMHGHQGFLRMRGLNQEMMNMYITHGLSGTVVSGADVPISGAGTTHAIAQGPSVNKVQKGIPLLIDYGGGYNGYITDETRAYAIGELKDIYLKGHAVAREIIEETMEFAKEGVDGTEVFMKALHKTKHEGLYEYFMGYGEGKVGFIGHGLGLEINELPVITPRHKIILQEGMVFAFEPKFIFPGEGSVGIEVDFIVRKNGLERVTDSPINITYV